MKISTKETTMIALFLISTMSASVVLTQTATAHTSTWNIPSFAYVVAQPNPVGVGQRVMIYMWVDIPMPSAALTNDIRRHDYTLTITKPDGQKETENWPIIDDPTGIQFFPYSPTQVGTYTLDFEYAGQVYTWSGTYQGDTFETASATTTLTVQEEPLPAAINSYPLPTEYWTRPIEGQNTDWYLISSNWLNGPYIRTGTTSTGGAGYGRFQSDGTGPNSPHIMWTKPLQDGGVVGGTGVGDLGNTYYTGGSYNTRFSSAIVMYGRLYYQEPYGNSGGGGDVVAVDLRTGEEIWRIDASATGVSLVPSFGYLYGFDSGNQHGVLPNGILVAPYSVGGIMTPYGPMGGTPCWAAYDPRTGVLTTMNITDVPAGTATGTLAASSGSAASIAGPKGEYLIYTLTNLGTTTDVSYYLTQWNSSNVFGGEGMMGISNWYSGTADAKSPSAYDWNISIPTLKGQWSIYRDVAFNNIMLLIQGDFGTGPRTNGEGANATAISLKPGSIGTVLWTKYYPPAPNNVTRRVIAVDADSGTFVTEDKETMMLTGFSLADGSQVWTTEYPEARWDTMRRDTLAAYGNLYCAGFDGVLKCYDMTNGTLLWTYGNGGEGNSTYAGLATSYGHYPIFVDVIADGKVYLGSTEHSPDAPWYKDAEYRCINATTGEEIWTMMGWGTGMYVGQYDVVADGFFVYLNCYDMQVYSVGKGPSATTVSIQDDVITHGDSVLVKGSVLDIAAGTEQDEQAARFPNGVPAVSDASMGEWMEYIYMQKPRPTDTVGVEVTLSVLDSNNNWYEIGTATTDANGFFHYTWTPIIPGDYTVYATFEGSEGYWPSQAETAFTVMEAPEATPPPTPEPASTADLYFVPATAGIIVAIAVVGVVLMLMLRKR
jgi:outer membrane protein assembly factor BamB